MGNIFNINDFEKDLTTKKHADESTKSIINDKFKHEPEIFINEINVVNEYVKHGPLQYGKKLYIGEFFAENFIRLVALLSIGFIIAIFYYVFQESLYAFKNPDEQITIEQTSDNNDTQNEDKNLKQESYNPNAENSETSNNSGELKQEQYQQEVYSSGTSDNDLQKEFKSEQSSADSSNNNKLEEATSENEEIIYEEKGIALSELVTPNDYINNKPDYVWQPISTIPKFSIIPLFYGALKVSIIGILIAAPLAILAAIFTVAFAPKWLKEIIKPAIEILAGFPSVVIGFFCLMTLATIIQELFHTTYRLNSFVGGIGMALAVIPIIYTITEDALTAVPKYMKEASLALGGSRWQTAWRVMLPAATPGVFAALILGFGRAFGETMIALMATGNAALVSGNIFESVRTMAATIGAEMAEVEFRGVHYGVLFLIGALLFIITFSLNALAEFYVRKKLMKKFQGS